MTIYEATIYYTNDLNNPEDVFCGEYLRRFTKRENAEAYCANMKKRIDGFYKLCYHKTLTILCDIAEKDVDEELDKSEIALAKNLVSLQTPFTNK